MGSFIDSETPRKPYEEVKSKYIRDKIQRTEFENTEQRKYINNLILIEEVILENINLKFGSGQAFNQVKNRNSYEYDKIQKELKPERYRERKLGEYRRNLKKEKEKKQEAEKNIGRYRKKVEDLEDNSGEKENKNQKSDDEEVVDYQEQWGSVKSA